MGHIYCSVYGCKNSTRNKILSFFCLPKDSERFIKWLEVIGREDLMKKDKPTSYRVCSVHFEESVFTNKRLSSNAIPTLNLPNNLDSINVLESCEDAKNKETKIAEVKKNIIKSKTTSKATQTHFLHKYSTKKIQTDISLLNDTSVTASSSAKKVKSSTDFTDEESTSKRRRLEDPKDQIPLCSQDNKNNFIEKFISWQKELQSKYKGNRYDAKFKVFCLNLYFSSPQTYKFLEKCFTMPSVKTLQRMKTNFSSGVNEGLLKILSERLKGMPPNSKYCTLCMDEIILNKKLYYDIHTDEVIGFHEIDGKRSKEVAANAFILMLRGCFENYKQPLGYAFIATNKNYSELNDWVDQTIDRLFSCGFEVCAVVSDQGPTFMNLAKVKGVTVDKPFFNVNGKRVFYIFDVPHLVKCIRNDLLTYDFIINDIDIASWSHIEQFYNKDKERHIRLAYKLTDDHINPTKSQRMELCYATQIFSHSVAAGMSTDIELGNLPFYARGTVNFILKMNNLFDVLNSRKKQDPYEYKKAFSGAEYQKNYLTNALNMFQNIKAKKSASGQDITTEIHTFIGFQTSITGILQLFEYFSSLGLKFIFTRRLNTDLSEHNFGTIRQPSPIQFKRSFSKLVIDSLVKNSNLSNCEQDLEKLLSKDDLILSSFFVNRNPVIPSPVFVGTTDYRFDIPKRNAIKYVCGYLLRKCSQKHFCSNFKRYIEQNETVEMRDHQAFKSKIGDLKVPPDDFVAYVEVLETMFLNKFESAVVNPGAGKALVNIMEAIERPRPCPCFPYNYLISLFVRMRIYYTIKSVNKKINYTLASSCLNIKHL